MLNCFIELSNESENVLVLSTDREAGGVIKQWTFELELDNSIKAMRHNLFI